MALTVHKKRLFFLGIIVLLLIITWGVWEYLAGQRISDPFIDAQEPPPLVVPTEDIHGRVLDTDIVLPAGMLVVTKLRSDYQDGDMRLMIPRLELDTLVGSDTSQATLAKGPGLYKYAQIPNLYNTNVSIAGHRDLSPYDFYHLDQLSTGDLIYLIYKNKLFCYEYRSTTEVEPTNWDPIRVYYDSRVTLTTCTPLGTFKKRMIVVGELISVEDFREEDPF